jgi:RNA polymerase sigma factor (sigma-70 family)
MDLGQKLCRLALLSDTGEVSDGTLLKRFLSARDERAFEVILRRHGPMVLRVCRRALADENDVEDAFQATFLVFIRRARSIHKPESLASWLHGVAHRTVAKARSVQFRRRSKERPMRELPCPTGSHASWSEVRQVLDEEIQRLREIYQGPVILCDLEGKTRKEAAQLIGCPEGTLSTRLMRGRAMLARRLKSRGVALSTLPLNLLHTREASAGLPPALFMATKRALAGAITFSAADLAKGVLRNMLFIHVLKRAALVFTTMFACAGIAVPCYRDATPLPNSLPPVGEQPVALPLPKPPDPGLAALRLQLAKTCNLSKGIDPTPLSEALANISDLYDITIALDSTLFKSVGVDDVDQRRVSAPPLAHVRADTVLRMIAKQANGVCLMTGKKVVVVPNEEKIVKTLLAQKHFLLPAEPSEAEHRSTILALLEKAYRESAIALRSGSGHGTYEIFGPAAKGISPAPTTSAKFTLDFDHRRYYLKLDYIRSRYSMEKQILIADNSAVFLSSFMRPRGHGNEASAELSDPGSRPALLEFVWDPSRVARSPIRVDTWVGKAGGNVAIEAQGDNGYTIHLANESGREFITVLREFGWNLITWKYTLKGQSSPAGGINATWKKTAGVWHVVAMEETRGIAPEQSRHVLRFDDFTPNVATSAKLFRLSALELPEGAGILDRRTEGKGEWSRYRAFPGGNSRRFFDMEAEFEGLPPPALSVTPR